MNVVFLVFAVVLLAIAGQLLMTLVSIFWPQHRMWPLETRSWTSWRALANWGLSATMLLGVPILGYLDWDSFLLPRPSTIVVGSVLVVSGVGITLQSMLRIGVDTSMGFASELRTNGLYRYTRNPQVVGDIIALLGVMVLSNATLAILSGTGAIIVHLLYPFAEEPWLQETYGERYERYHEIVPRFIGRTTIQRLVTSLR
jgi:protein-S-isoprenylcysteine O-methyltransferase Ste14